ncbi:MAG: hypothetical protein ACNA78_06765 [Balneolaceae bacterium]
MNIGLVTSYIIAGVILLSIVMMNINVQSSTVELTMTQIMRDRVVNITEILNDDLPNMGYDVYRTTRDNDAVENKILALGRTNKISFYRNIQEIPDRKPDLITWELLNDDPQNSKNPDHKTLIRIVEDGVTGQPDTLAIKNSVTRFQVRYYNTVGADFEDNVSPPGQLKNNLDNIRQIHLVLEVQSPEPVLSRATGPERFVRSVWEKRFTPLNLQI